MYEYKIEKVGYYNDEIQAFLADTLPDIAKLFENVFDYRNALIKETIEKGVVLICRRNGEIRGMHVSWLFKSPLDAKIKILQQQLFYVKPDSGRTAYHLFNKFIDIGKHEANHIITMRARQTNIKPASLENLGFKELEVLYRLEV